MYGSPTILRLPPSSHGVQSDMRWEIPRNIESAELDLVRALFTCSSTTWTRSPWLRIYDRFGNKLVSSWQQSMIANQARVLQWQRGWGDKDDTETHASEAVDVTCLPLLRVAGGDVLVIPDFFQATGDVLSEGLVQISNIVYLL